MSNRVARRQGVIYGPPRPDPGDGGNGALIGRLLGIGMVGLAVAVLAGAVVLVNRPPSATPTRQIGPTASPPPASQSALASVAPTPSQATPEPTPIPTPFIVTVQVGPGFVTFGTQLNDDRTIADPRALFVPSDRISWSAYLTDPNDAVDVVVRLYKLDDSVPGGERLLSEGAAQPKVKEAVLFTRDKLSPSRALDGPGIYLVRYIRTDVVLAEGYFELGG
ncbi:MAG TPA: hypothetical protein VM284_04725 [Candidatus Limnocylindria bacterium]|nr:hypothetical protein [Candidatus Limnocylindria bacterium]